MKRKLKPFVTPLIYTLSLVLLVMGVYLVEDAISDSVFKSNNEDIPVVDSEDDDVNNTPIYSDIPVVNTDTQIIRPYSDMDVVVVSDYYDHTASNEEQEKSILYYQDTYMQNSGVDYALSDNSQSFDVVSILDGEVISVSEDDILGNIIEIKYSNDLIGVFQSLGEVRVNKGDMVVQGQIIGVSGNSNIGKDMGSHLHFELYHQGLVVNPEEYYGKLLGEL